jgi:hypothetical protein
MHKNLTIAPFRLGVVLAFIRSISQSTAVRSVADVGRKMIPRQTNYSNFIHYSLAMMCDWNKMLIENMNTKLHFSMTEVMMLLSN